MRTWPRILMVVLCVTIMMLMQPIGPAGAQECPGGYSVTFQLDGEVNHPKTYALQVIVAFMRDNVLLGEGEGMVRIINPGDKAGARRVFHITHIRVLTPPLE